MCSIILEHNLTFASGIKSLLLSLQHRPWPQWKPTHEGNSSGGLKMPPKTSPRASAHGHGLQTETAHSVLWGLNLWPSVCSLWRLKLLCHQRHFFCVTFLCYCPSLRRHALHLLSKVSRTRFHTILAQLSFINHWICFFSDIGHNRNHSYSSI